MRDQAKRGYKVPQSLPSLEYSDFGGTEDEANSVLKNYEANLPSYMKERGADSLFSLDDEWEYPPISTGLRIMSPQILRGKEQVVGAIKRVAGYQPKEGNKEGSRSIIDGLKSVAKGLE